MFTYPICMQKLNMIFIPTPSNQLLLIEWYVAVEKVFSTGLPPKSKQLMNIIRAVLMYRYLVSLQNIDRLRDDLWWCFSNDETEIMIYFRMISSTRMTREAKSGYEDLWIKRMSRSKSRSRVMHTTRLMFLDRNILMNDRCMFFH